jgi:hypothetical protein
MPLVRNFVSIQITHSDPAAAYSSARSGHRSMQQDYPACSKGDVTNS